MNPTISEIINSFESSSKIPKKKYNDFLVYVYMTFDEKILSCKKNKMIDKYKKMRLSILKYIVANERVITAEICKNK
jgi:hypothetical protein